MMIEIQKILTSKDGTQKFLLQLGDGNLIETVLMKHPYGNSICITSQAGCNMGCAFCASGLVKKARDLTAEEMLAQVMTVQSALSKSQRAETPEEPPAATRLVVMGGGEPFDNYREVLRFCDTVSTPDALTQFAEKAGLFLCGKPAAVAPRHITVSTCGIAPKICEFAETEKRYQLAVSLHAPNNKLRNQLMPVNKKYPLEELMKAAEKYCEVTRRRITFEYLLLDGINDSAEDAAELARLLTASTETAAAAGRESAAWRVPQSSDYFYVNLIPYNPVSEFGFRKTEKQKALRFYDVLMKRGVRATLRKERGADITAACGQLRLQKNNPQAIDAGKSDFRFRIPC